MAGLKRFQLLRDHGWRPLRGGCVAAIQSSATRPYHRANLAGSSGVRTHKPGPDTFRTDILSRHHRCGPSTSVAND